MSNDVNNLEAAPDAKIWPLPGMIAIALYMLVLAATVTFDVVGRHIPPLMLVLAPLFVVASFGLLRMFRWAWALALAAVFLLMVWYFWILSSTGESFAAVMGVLNLALFFYLVRPDVRSRLK